MYLIIIILHYYASGNYVFAYSAYRVRSCNIRQKAAQSNAKKVIPVILYT